MKAPLRIVGSVVDTETGKPLERFTLIRGTDPGDGRAPWWMRSSGRTISKGRYETAIVQEGIRFRIRVEAEGYMPGESTVFRAYDPDEGEITYDFKLSKAAPVAGSVLGPDGQPLGDADVYLATERMNITNRKAEYYGNNRTVKTDGAGRFRFSAEVEPFCLVVVHAQGIAMITEGEFESSVPLSIQPWTSENQSLQIIRRPAPGQSVDFPDRFP